MFRTNKNVRISIVEDDEDDFLIISDYLKNIQGIEIAIHWCSNYESALSDILNRKHDLYFVDYRLGAKSGVDLLQQALDNNCTEPIILLTGYGNYSVDIKAMELGVVDYLAKAELTVEKLERSIRYALERTNTLKALRLNERKYRGIFEKSRDIIFIADHELQIIDVNDSIQAILGYSKEEALQMNITNLIQLAQHEKYFKHILNTENEIKDWEVALISRNGEKKLCIMNIGKEVHANNDLYYQGIIHDITNVRKVEKANLLAEKLAMTGRLMHTLAHEVRNPLNNITLSVEQMSQNINDDASSLYIDIIKRNSKRIDKLISELLNTSNPVETNLKPEFIQIILDDVISATIDRLSLNKIKLSLNYHEEGITILADKNKLVIALLNIIINAVEAMKVGEGELLINLFLKDQYAIMVIKDNGCGISEENINHLFEPYFTQKRNGVGLGLAFTLNILKAHNADIEVASTLNEGTVFTISFPAHSMQ